MSFFLNIATNEQTTLALTICTGIALETIITMTKTCFISLVDRQMYLFNVSHI